MSFSLPPPPRKSLGDTASAPSLLPSPQGDTLYLVLRLRGCGWTPREPRHSHEESAVDVRKQELALPLRRNRGRRVMFVNRTDRFLHIYVFPTQEGRHQITASKVAAAGLASLELTAPSATTSHLGAFQPSVFSLKGMASSPPRDPPVHPPFHVFDIWRNTGRRVHYMVVTVDDDHVRVWHRSDAEGGTQIHIQQSMFCHEARPLFKGKYVEDDGESNVLSVLTKRYFPSK